MENSEELPLSVVQNIVKTIRESDLPVVTFLLHDFSTAECKVQGEQVTDSKATTGTLEKLLEVFQQVVQEKDMGKLRAYLTLYIINYWEKSIQISRNKRTKSFTDFFNRNEDKLREFEEVILRLHEILLLFSVEVPESLDEAFMNICKDKRICEKIYNGKDKEFFVYAENKTLRKICDSLSVGAVCQMYNNLRKNTEKDFYKSASAKKLLEVSLSDLTNINGLKEASFYFFVVALFKEGLFNRIHTDYLCDYLKNKENRVPLKIRTELQQYPLASKPPGICIIFNMEKERMGAEHDLRKIKNLFKKKFKYDVVVVIEPTKEDVSSTIETLKADSYKFYDSLVVVFMSHGTETCLNVADGDLHRRLDLIDPITKIKWLAKKPKLFFIQACASKPEQAEPGTDKTKRGDAKRDVKRINDPLREYRHCIDREDLHPFADTLISHATKWYDVAARIEETGSPYINILVNELEQCGTKEPIQEVLRRVHYDINMLKMSVEDQVQPHRQAPYFESSLQKVFIFPRQ